MPPVARETEVTEVWGGWNLPATKVTFWIRSDFEGRWAILDMF